MVENAAAQTAEHIAALAKTYLDKGDDKAHPIESGEVAGQAKKELLAEFDDLLPNNAKMRAVCIELEKIGQKVFTSLPNIEIKAEDGAVSSIVFRPSSFDNDSTMHEATVSFSNVNAWHTELSGF